MPFHYVLYFEGKMEFAFREPNDGPFVWALYGVILFLLQRIQIESILLGGEG
jgi:hypothetical protein